MPRNEDGEFELILGNKQLLSVFFIVVVLLGVFFTMGYIVGRNSAPVGAPETASRRGSDSKPIVLDSATPSPVGQAAPPPETKAASPEPAATEPEAAKPKPVEEPPKKKEEPPKKAETPKPEPKAEKPTPKPEPAKKEAAPAKPRSVEASPAGPRVTEPSSGMYLQVSAVRRPEAEALAEILQKKGFPATLTPSSKEGIFRVVVGPLKDNAAAAKTRADLESAGMKSPILVRY